MPDDRNLEANETTGAEHRGLSRRQFIPGAAGLVALGAAGVVGYELHGSSSSAAPAPTHTVTTSTPQSASPTTATSAGVQSFVTRPDLRPPVVRIDNLQDASATSNQPRFIAIAPISALNDPTEQHGPMLVDRQGRLIWFQPEPGSTFDVQVQSYQGKPVLTWWQGAVVGAHGAGVAKVVDSTYKTVATVGTTKSPIDLHEFNLTSNGTALVTLYTSNPTDLSGIGGPAKYDVWAGHALEVDVATGKILFQWNSLDHVGVAESYKSLPPKHDKNPYDYFHINSICELPDGNLLISARDTWALYKVHRQTGEILWRLGGKRSDFKVAEAAKFSWQHHVRAPAANTITAFDNAPNTGERSRGLVLSFDESKRTVDLKLALTHPAAFLSRTLGSVQLLDSGDVFVGWGAQPYMSSYGATGTMTADGQLPVGIRSYRTFAVDWTGYPTGAPDLVARANPAGGFVVFASWNGATEIDRWIVMSGTHRASLSQVGSQPWSGFETVIVVNSQGPYFQVVAVDSNGKELGRSEVV